MTNQKKVEQELLNVVSTYNAVSLQQLYAMFKADGLDQYVGRAVRVLEKAHRIYINPYTRIVARNENSYEEREKGTLLALWVLISLMKQKKIEEHFLAGREEYPVRIIFAGDAKIYDIMYVPQSDIELVNNLFERKKIESSGHIVIVDSDDYISAIKIQDVTGYCVVKEGDDVEIEYFRTEI